MNKRVFINKISHGGFRLLTIISVLLSVFIFIGLFLQAIPLLKEFSMWSLLSSNVWKPMQGKFGFFPFITGTLWVTSIAIFIAVPLCIMATIYLSIYTNWRIKNFIIPIVDLLSGIPPIIFGVWGTLTIVPIFGYSVLSGGIVLAVMIFPLMISILMDVFAAVPRGLSDASLALGATPWETIKYVVFRKALPGIIAAIVLSISRAFGETIAVLMVCGNMVQVPHSIKDRGYPLTALIANNYGEMLSIPMYGSALLFAAGILFVIIFVFNAISRLVLSRIEKSLHL